MKGVIETKNGLKIIYKRKKSVDGVAVIIHFLAGSANEGKNKRGLAHLVEHCLCNCSNEILSKQELYDSFSFFPYRNASTSIYSLQLVGLCNKNDFELLINNLTSGFTKFTNFENEFEDEKKVVLQEIATRRKTNSMQAFSHLFKKAHQEKNFVDMKDELVSGDSESVSNLTAQDVLDFKEEFFSIKNVVVDVVGNVSLKRVLKACEKYIVARLKKDGKVGYDYPQSKPLKQGLFIKEEPVEAQKSLLQIDWRYKDGERYMSWREMYVKKMVARVTSSMALDKFRVQNSSCYGVSQRFYYDFKDYTGSFIIECAHDKVEKNYQLFLEFVKDIKENGLSKKVFDFEYKSYFDSYNLDWPKLFNMARSLINDYTNLGEILSKRGEKRHKKICQKITFEEVNDYARKAFVGNPSIVLLTKTDINIDKSKARVLLKKPICDIIKKD